MSGTDGRFRVVARTARPGDLPAVLALVRQYRIDAHAEGVLTGAAPLYAAAAGFRRLLADAGHRVVLAVMPGPNSSDGAGAEAVDGEVAVGLAILGLDPLSLVLDNPHVTVETFVVHGEHRRRGVGTALLGAAAGYAEETGADHVVVAVGGHEAERQRFFARLGFAPLSTRRVVSREMLARSLAARRRRGAVVPGPRRAPLRRRPIVADVSVLRPVGAAET